jgi:hypothetical protein
MNRAWGWLLASAVVACATTPREQTVERARELLKENAVRDPGNLELTCKPLDAEVRVNGVLQGFCSDFGSTRTLRLGEGMQSVEVRRSGFWPYETAISPGGARTRISVQLEPVKQGGKG